MEIVCCILGTTALTDTMHRDTRFFVDRWITNFDDSLTEEVRDGNWILILKAGERLQINDDEGPEGWKSAVLREKSSSIGVTVRLREGGSRMETRLYKNTKERDQDEKIPWFTHIVVIEGKND